MRKSELAALRWSDLDVATGQLCISRQLLTGGAEPVFVATKGKRARTIDLAAETLELLKTHRTHQATHNIRHRTLLLSAGVSPNVVRDRLGHKKVETTLTVYAHALPGQQKEAARRLAALLHG